ncbi:collectin-10 [Leptinotarsa decemlineata]|uniref:collectin-10 n=1 Tax=Leptinotarsa decemlineata TaxID=7539 RepID=UPI003D309376
MGADLADVSSEIRTRHLSKAINNSLLDWYKVAYIGLDDIDQEGSFMTVSGSPLTCSPFRAWAPGHPRSSRVNEDCVVLDTDKMWRVVDCKSRLPSLCEFYPNKPEKANDLFGVSCTGTHDKKKRKKCEAQQSLFELFKNASRKEKCYITNYEDNLTLSYP